MRRGNRPAISNSSATCENCSTALKRRLRQPSSSANWTAGAEAHDQRGRFGWPSEVSITNQFWSFLSRLRLVASPHLGERSGRSDGPLRLIEDRIELRWTLKKAR
jgi:hypothetical protein